MSRDSDPKAQTRPDVDPASFYRQVVEGMRCAILTIDEEGTVLTINEMARQILDVHEGVGMPVSKALRRHPRLAEVLLNSLEMAQPPNRAEMEIRSREDDGRTIGFTISPIADESTSQGVALFFKDLTQVERQEEQDRLRDRLAALGQMAASMAHEIRNPLASIEVTATLLKRRLDADAAEAELVDKIVAEVSRLNSTVSRGLEFARPIAPERNTVQLGELLNELIDKAQNRFPDNEIAIHIDQNGEVPPCVVDRALVSQVFSNLIVNAFEAMGTHGNLWVTIEPVARPGVSPRTAEVTIRDDGPGIAPEVRQKIFYPFVTTKKNGSGIGLAMARKIIECHHGMIDVDTHADGGTVFRVRLPCGGTASATSAALLQTTAAGTDAEVKSTEGVSAASSTRRQRA